MKVAESVANVVEKSVCQTVALSAVMLAVSTALRLERSLVVKKVFEKVETLVASMVTLLASLNIAWKGRKMAAWKVPLKDCNWVGNWDHIPVDTMVSNLVAQLVFGSAALRENAREVQQAGELAGR